MYINTAYTFMCERLQYSVLYMYVHINQVCILVCSNFGMKSHIKVMINFRIDIRCCAYLRSHKISYFYLSVHRFKSFGCYQQVQLLVIYVMSLMH